MKEGPGGGTLSGQLPPKSDMPVFDAAKKWLDKGSFPK